MHDITRQRIVLLDGALHFTVPETSDNAKALHVLRSGMGLSYAAVVTLRHTPGGLLVNGQPARTVDRLRAGDRLEVRVPEPPPEPLAPFEGSARAQLLFADDWCAVYDKPAGMPTHPAHHHQSDTLANIFREQWPDKPFRAVGRLDADTSGLIVTALNAYTAFSLAERVDKEYEALVQGILRQKEGTVDAPLLHLCESDGSDRVKEGGLRAVTHYRVIGEENGLSRVRFVLETGRTHQIRAHMAHIGHPLAGDTRYGGDPSLYPRHALHCIRLSFTEPDGCVRRFESKPPF